MKKKLMLLILPLLSGCLIIPIRSTQRPGPTSLEVEGIALMGARTYQRGNTYVAVSLTATLLAVQQGSPIVEDKISFGLYPGYELNENCEEGVGIYMVCSPVVTCLALGIPLIDAILFEPFLPPADGENVVRTISPVGFCKYALPARRIVDVSSFSIEYNGVHYNSNANGQILIPWFGREYNRGECISVKLMAANERTSREIEQKLQEIIGMTYSVKFK